MQNATKGEPYYAAELAGKPNAGARWPTANEAEETTFVSGPQNLVVFITSILFSPGPMETAMWGRAATEYNFMEVIIEVSMNLRPELWRDAAVVADVNGDSMRISRMTRTRLQQI